MGGVEEVTGAGGVEVLAFGKSTVEIGDARELRMISATSGVGGWAGDQISIRGARNDRTQSPLQSREVR